MGSDRTARASTDSRDRTRLLAVVLFSLVAAIGFTALGFLIADRTTDGTEQGLAETAASDQSGETEATTLTSALGNQTQASPLENAGTTSGSDAPATEESEASQPVDGPVERWSGEFVLTAGGPADFDALPPGASFFAAEQDLLLNLGSLNSASESEVAELPSSEQGDFLGCVRTLQSTPADQKDGIGNPAVDDSYCVQTSAGRTALLVVIEVQPDAVVFRGTVWQLPTTS